MNFLRLFRKPTKSEVYLQIADQIVLNALVIRLEIADQEPSVSDRVGRELAFFGLYMVDPGISSSGPAGRNEIIDAVSQYTATRYIEGIFSKAAPPELIRTQKSAFIEQYNYRIDVYGHCREVMSGPMGASAGSAMFALAYFLHAAISGDYEFDATDILCGRRKIEMSEMKHFARMDQQMMWTFLSHDS